MGDNVGNKLSPFEVRFKEIFPTIRRSIRGKKFVAVRQNL
jgi:hypothetical protein